MQAFGKVPPPGKINYSSILGRISRGRCMLTLTGLQRENVQDAVAYAWQTLPNGGILLVPSRHHLSQTFLEALRIFQISQANP